MLDFTQTKEMLSRVNLDDLIAAVAEELDDLPLDARPSPEELRRLKAIAIVAERAEQQQISPFQKRILDTLQTLSPRPDSPPVSTVKLVTAIGGLSGRWQAWYHLNILEEKGLVYRPRGPRSGWKVCSAEPFPNIANK